MKGFILTLIIFVLLALPGLVGAEVGDCSSPDIPTCEYVELEGKANDGSDAGIFIQRFEFEQREDTLSDEFLTEYLVASNEETALFWPIEEVTNEILRETDLFMGVDDFRVFVGTSDLITPEQPSMMIAVENNGETFYFFAQGKIRGFLEYADEVSTKGDLSIEFEGFKEGLPGTKKESI